MRNYACLKNWKIESLIGEGAQGRVYLLTREVNGRLYQSALKEITIPTLGQRELLRLKKYPMVSVDAWIKNIIAQIQMEIDLLYMLKGHPHIVPIEEHYIEPHPEGFGRVVLLRMPYLKPMSEMCGNGIKSPLDLCEWYLHMTLALKACHELGILHRDLKLQNMFVDQIAGKTVYRLGDFGIASRKDLLHEEIWSGNTMLQSPERSAGNPYRQTDDWYALNKVLCQCIGQGCSQELKAVLNQSVHPNLSERLVDADEIYQKLCQFYIQNRKYEIPSCMELTPLQYKMEGREEKKEISKINMTSQIHVFVSLKGTGKTTLCAMLAMELAMRKNNYRVALLDLDCYCPGLFYQFDFSVAHLSQEDQLMKMNGISHLFEQTIDWNKRKLSDYAFRFNRIDIFTRHGDFELKSPMPHLKQVINRLSREYDFIFIDMESSNMPHLSFDEITIHMVTTCEPSHVITNLKWIEGFIFHLNPKTHISLILNRLPKKNVFHSLMGDIKNSFVKTNVQWLYTIEIGDYTDELLHAKWQGFKSLNGLKMMQDEIKKWGSHIEKEYLGRKKHDIQ